MSAGLYIHIPFCKSRCIYCDFYSQTKLETKNYINALINEAKNYKKEWENIKFNTIYFGGGTPSLLKPEEIATIINNVRSLFCFDSDTEITLECNPDDVDEKFAYKISQTGVNRISIGIQSLDDKTLKFLSRRHNSQQAINAIDSFIKAGIENLSVDLIYGIPALTAESWIKQLKTIASLHVKHISAYMLTTHENTLLSRMQYENTVNMPSEDECYEQYLLTQKILSEANIQQYEISNFAVPGYESRHNQKYWEGEPWLGLGPSSHSYKNPKRWANIADTKMYINDPHKFAESRNSEILDEKSQYNEYIMNHLRTTRGLDIVELEKLFPKYIKHFKLNIDLLNKEWYHFQYNQFYLSQKGMFVSDYITAKLFL